MSTRLVDPVTMAPMDPEGPVLVTVTKGTKTMGSGPAFMALGKWRFTYQPSAWETGDYVMHFAWSTLVAGTGASGEPIELSQAMSLGLPFSLRADLGSVRDMNLAKPLHPCDFPWYQRINMACEADELICKQGKWLMLWHKSSSRHCSCWNEVGGSALTTCPYCAGAGIPHRQIPFKGRDEWDDKTGRTFQAGTQLVMYTRFFVPRDFEGGRGDQIWDVRWNQQDAPERGFEAPPLRRWGILFVKDHYGDNHDGRISFKEVYTEEMPLANNQTKVT